MENWTSEVEGRKSWSRHPVESGSPKQVQYFPSPGSRETMLGHYQGQRAAPHLEKSLMMPDIYGDQMAFHQAQIQMSPSHRGQGYSHGSPNRGNCLTSPRANMSSSYVKNTLGGPRGRGTAPTRGMARRGRLASYTNRFPRDPRVGFQPAEALQLPIAFGMLKHEFSEAGREILGPLDVDVGRDKFEPLKFISQKTGAYIRYPSYTDTVIYLCGEPRQIAVARHLVEQLINRASTMTHTKKKIAWARIYAHSSSKEASMNRQELSNSILKQLRKAPDPSQKLPERLIFLWPCDEFPIEDAFGPELEAFDPIRAELGLHVYQDGSLPDYIWVDGHRHEDINAMIRHLRMRWYELMVSRNIQYKVYTVEPPEFTHHRIVVNTLGNIARPSLERALLTGIEFEHAEWLNRVSLARSNNATRFLKATEKCIKGLACYRGYLQMRANFGSFFLDEYRLPRKPELGYSFEEFREMLLHEKTKGRLLTGLDIGQDEMIDRFSRAAHLFEPAVLTPDFLRTTEPAYSVIFQFGGVNNAALRLEAEFTRRPGAQEYEAIQRRWIKSEPSQPFNSSARKWPLQVPVVDFEKADWQLQIKSLQLCDASSVDSVLRSFSHSIGFRSDVASENITAETRRRVTFPQTAPVLRIIEKAAVRYRLRDTNYTLEIARYDEYTRTIHPIHSRVCTIPGEMSEVPSTTWAASIFGVRWDNMLGQHANMATGDSTGWNGNLDTFFPVAGSLDKADEYSGFKQFLSLVKEVAALLGPDNVVWGLQGTPKFLDAELGTLF